MQYTNGDISKREFLEHNFNYFQNENATPYLKIDSYEKGMYNYQYYNGMAKFYRMLAKDVRHTKKHARYYNYYLNLSNKYYHYKDETALTLLRLQNFENVSCYYIKCDSSRLNHQLYEIVLNDKKEAIFHSKAPWLLNILRTENVFYEGIQHSLIEEYINERY
ncbi:DUF6648 family protein [Peptoniphilus equinus]